MNKIKKIFLLVLSLVCLCSLCVFASSNDCDKKQKCEKPCTKTFEQCLTECFLCTEKTMANAFEGMNLSSSQICNAKKLQEKYEQETLSIEEKIQCEEEKLNELKRNCSKKSAIRKQKRHIRELKKTRKKICDCYQKEFKDTLSNDQRHRYNKNIK